MLSRPYGVPRWRHVNNSSLVQCTDDGNEGLVKPFQIFGYIATVIIINNYRSVHYVFQDIKLKKVRFICFHLGFEFEAGLNSVQRGAEENTDHYASKWVSGTRLHELCTRK